jgi:hypothetical protein
MTSRRQDPSGASIAVLLMAMLAVAGFVLAISLRLLCIVAQPLAVGLGSLAGTFRNITVDLWRTSVIHPGSATGRQHRLARRADAGDTQAMRDLLREGTKALCDGLAKMAALHSQVASALPTEIQPGQAGAIKKVRGSLDDTLRSLEVCYADAGTQLGHLYEAAIALWEAAGNGTTVAGDAVRALHTGQSSIASLVQGETERLTRVQNLVHAAATAAQGGSASGQFLASARSELIATPSPDPWTAAISFLTETVAKAPTPATAPVAA